MPRKLWRVVTLSFSLCAGLSLMNCGGTGSAPIGGLSTLQGVSVSVTPAAMTVVTGTVQTFTATVNDSSVQAVQWEVNGIPGGAPIIGTIDKSGNYTAPQFVPNPANVVITAVANADNTKSGNANVTLTGALIPAQVYMSPTGTAYVQAGTALNLAGGVIGPADTSVVWQVNGVANGNSTVGTIAPGANNTAVYTAPKTVPNPATVTIKVVSHAEPDNSTSCAVVISAGPPGTATVTISPVVAVAQAQTPVTFTAHVDGPSDTSVSWQVNQSTGGNTTDGTIASVAPDQGMYTAPASIPANGSTVTVTAFSNSQPTRTASAQLTISPPPANGVSISIKGSGSEVETGAPATFTATVGNASVQTVTWQVNGITGGNSIYGTIQPDANIPDQGDYVAPAQVPPQNAVVIGAIPAAAPTITATFPITITPPPPPTLQVVCFPTACINGSEQLPTTATQEFVLQTSLSNPNSSWYVCVYNTNPGNCTLGGNTALGTISPDQGTNDVVYTAPASIPNPAIVLIKAIPDAAPTLSAFSTVVITNKISVQVTPPGPFPNVQVETSAGPFSANVIGSADQTVTWEVNNIPGGNSTVGTVIPDGGDPSEEDYIAPANVPNPATVKVTAVPEADPTVVSNAVSITIVPQQNNPSISVSPNPAPPIIFGGIQQFNATVQNAPPIVDWTLSPASGGVCTDPNPPTPCGSINPKQTDNQVTTYTAPTTPGLPDPYYVNITATIDADQGVFTTVKQEISNNAQGSISIDPPTLTVSLGSKDKQTISVIFNNIPDPGGTNVNWQPGCNTQAPNPTEHCGPSFGKGDGSGPGCFVIPGDPFLQCNDTSFVLTGTQTFQYEAPSLLGSDYQPQPQCTSSPPPANAVVPIVATVGPISNCSNGGFCTATLCVQITP